MGSLKASLKILQINLGKFHNNKAMSYTYYDCNQSHILRPPVPFCPPPVVSPSAGSACGVGALLRPQQSHVALVLEQLVLQLHVHSFALDLLHLRID